MFLIWHLITRTRTMRNNEETRQLLYLKINQKRNCQAINKVFIVKPKFNINVLTLVLRIIKFSDHPAGDRCQHSRQGQQEQGCAISRLEAPGQCQLRIDNLSYDDDTSKGESKSKVWVHWKEIDKNYKEVEDHWQKFQCSIVIFCGEYSYSYKSNPTSLFVSPA